MNDDAVQLARQARDAQLLSFPSDIKAAIRLDAELWDGFKRLRLLRHTHQRLFRGAVMLYWPAPCSDTSPRVTVRPVWPARGLTGA